MTWLPWVLLGLVTCLLLSMPLAILLGSAMPAHILTPSVTSRGVVNMTALAAVEAQGKMETAGHL